jgi:hypothetical protein
MGERWPKQRPKDWRQPRHSSRSGGRGWWAGGWRLGHQNLGATGGRRVAGAQVRSGDDGHAGRGGIDLNRVRERGTGVHDIFWIRQ